MDHIFSSINPNIKPVYYLIAAIIALLSGAITRYYLRQKRISKAQAMAIVLLTIYIFLVFASTVFSRVSMDSYSYKLFPLWSYWEILHGSMSILWEDILNVILLLPAGILFPTAMGNDVGRKLFRRVVLIGFLISFAIEILQLILKRGLFEFDDMFHNTMGATIGYWVYQKMKRGRV